MPRHECARKRQKAPIQAPDHPDPSTKRAQRPNQTIPARETRVIAGVQLRVSIVELNSAVESDEDPFAELDGEKDRSYQKRAGWYDTDDNIVYLRVPAIDKIMQGHGKASFYDWLYKRGILHKPAKGDRWTVRVPRLAHRPSALQINLARLQNVVE